MDPMFAEYGRTDKDDTQDNLLATLQRLDLYNPFIGSAITIETIEQAAKIALNNFGKPYSWIVPPTHQVLSTEAAVKAAFENVHWDTINCLPAGLDPRDLKGIVPDYGYAKFQFLETLRRLDLGRSDPTYSYNISWVASAEL